ncbi:MAG: hypothetical protein KKA07_18780 [Bacteroidetes bacterium]|nr:hypothetical protein [Bacteroidota bacterium]MBU1721118.1 hypothetical protein [Bacteroidota bacterium]
MNNRRVHVIGYLQLFLTITACGILNVNGKYLDQSSYHRINLVLDQDLVGEKCFSLYSKRGNYVLKNYHPTQLKVYIDGKEWKNDTIDFRNEEKQITCKIAAHGYISVFAFDLFDISDGDTVIYRIETYTHEIAAKQLADSTNVLELHKNKKGSLNKLLVPMENNYCYVRLYDLSNDTLFDNA